MYYAAQVIRFEHQVARMFLVLAQHRIIVPVPPLDLEHLKKTTQKNELDSQSVMFEKAIFS
jgi:hypothetical protein